MCFFSIGGLTNENSFKKKNFLSNAEISHIAFAKYILSTFACIGISRSTREDTAYKSERML